MIYNTIQYVVDNGIGTLTFNRPTVANGFNIEMCKEILEVLDKAHNDESVRALLINAEGKGVLCRWRFNRDGARCKRRGY